MRARSSKTSCPSHPSDPGEGEDGLPPEGQQCGFWPLKVLTADAMLVARRLQELRRAKGIPLHMCFVDSNHTKNRTIPPTVLFYGTC